MSQSSHKGRSLPVFMKPGHCAGDLVGAPEWTILKDEYGLVELDVSIPDSLLNPRGQLFGGFTGTYVDMVSIFTVRTLYEDRPEFTWTSTVNMRIDYLEPVWGPRMRLKGELIKKGRSTCLVATHFMDETGNRLVYAITTMRMHEPDRAGGPAP